MRSRSIWICASLLTLVSCSPTGGQSPAPSASAPPVERASAPAAAEPSHGGSMRPSPLPAPGPLAVMDEPPIWQTAEQVQQACAAHLAAARARREALLAGQSPRTLDNTLRPFNALLVEVDRILPISELHANVHPERAVRDAAEACQQQAMKFLSDLKLDRGLYDALSSVERAGLDPLATRFLDHLLRDYRRAGVDKDEATRKELAGIQEQMVAVGQEFQRNIREDKRFLELDSAAGLAGLPADFVAAHKPGEDGKIRISTDYPDFFPFETYAKDEELRRKLYKVFLQRAYPANEAVLKKLLGLRHRYATLLGYPNWAAYNAEDKMVRDETTIANFLEKVSDLGRPRMQRELTELLARKRQDLPEASVIGAWDRFYYVQKLRAERFDVDSQQVRAYFPYAAVKEGVLSTVQGMFGLRFQKVEAPTWHAKVEAYDVYDGATRIARFYLDMHPREGKYGHAAEFAMLTGQPGVQLPSASLVCNFPDPSEGPALMEHGDVTTFFHEFGHLVHQLLAGRQPWLPQSGINCEWDFVEAPSQLLEEWAWDATVLARFAKHHETGEVIPAALVQRMRQAEEFGKGVHVMRQMFYAALSFAYHRKDPAQIDLLAAMQEVQRGYNPYPYEPETYTFANFGHIEGYSSMYYTYMWSLVLAKDLMTRFRAKGLLDAETALAYRKAVLEPGGAEDAAQMVETFLGRPSSFDAFGAWLSKD